MSSKHSKRSDRTEGNLVAPLARNLSGIRALVLAGVWIIAPGAFSEAVAAIPGPEDPAKIVAAEACGECHSAAYEVWKTTPHAKGFKTLHRKELAQRIAKNMGYRLIKRDSICYSCHFTAVEDEERLKVVSGVSCESCHGAARDWLDVHNKYGEGFTYQTEPEEHRRQRIAASREAGMRRPSDLYPLVANCFRCHSVPNEELVNKGLHPAGSADFEVVERSQGAIRHNFLDSFRGGGDRVNAESPPGRLRQLYAAGRIADLEFSLRGLALASEDGVYSRSMGRRVRSALAEVRAMVSVLSSDELTAVVGQVKALDLTAGSDAELLAAADAVARTAREYLGAHDGSQLAALDGLIDGTAESVDFEEETVLADTALDLSASQSPLVPSAVSGGEGEAATAATAAPAAPQVQGEFRRRLRPASKHRTVGPGKCSGCHGPQNEWWFGHPHYRSADPFFEGRAKNLQIARLYGISPSEMTRGRNLCMDCHGTVISGKESREVLDGVSCESCHGAAADWVEVHKEGDKALGRNRPGYVKSLQQGKRELRDLAQRAKVCTSCHYITDERLLSSGHVSGQDFDIVQAMAKVRHWQHGPAGASDLRASLSAELARRGPVPQVQVASLPTASATGSRVVARSSSPALGGPPQAASRPVASAGSAWPGSGRPASAAAPTVTRVEGEALSELPPPPAIDSSMSVEEALAVLQERLRLLQQLVDEGNNGDER